MVCQCRIKPLDQRVDYSFGNIVPAGSLWLVAGVETLIGLVLITWTASYLDLEMTRLCKIES